MPYSSVSGTWSPKPCISFTHNGRVRAASKSKSPVSKTLASGTSQIVGLDQPRAGIEARDDAPGGGGALGAGGGDLVQHDHVGELDLVDEELDEGARVLGVAGLAAVAQEVAAREVAGEVDGVDHGQHGVEPRHVGQATPSASR